MRTYRAWIVWRYEERNGRRTKVPCDPRSGQGTFASTTDSRTWATFDEAAAALEGGRYDGLGFVFSSGDPFAGVDLDAGRDPGTGALEPWAEKIVEALAGYAEVSPSGRGVHVIVRGKVPGRKRGSVEAYSMARFFTMTGEALR